MIFGNIFYKPAHIRFDAEVDPLVVFQVVQLEKCFRAKFTLVAAFGKVVSFHVVAQDGGELVLLITELTRIHCLGVLVNLFRVSVQGALPSKCLTALAARMFSEARSV